MKTYLIAFAIAFLTSVASTFAIRRIALSLGLVDRPHPARKIHRIDVPRIGGVAVLLAVLVPLASFYLYPEGVAIQAVREAPGKFPGLFLGAALACLLGLVDDVRGMKALVKLTGQIAVAVLMYYMDFRIVLLSNPFGSVIHLTWMSLPVTVLWYLAVMNAINLIDGMDGLAAGLSLIISMVLFILALVTANGVLGTTSIILGGALVGFLLFNFNPARIFLGDSGSILLGFLIATFSIMARVKGQAAVALVLPVIALGVPFLDVLLSIVRRLAYRQPVFTGDRKHIHHLLLQRGFTQRKTALLIYAMGVFFAAISVLMMFSRSTWINALLFVALLLTVAAIIRFLGYHRLAWYSFGRKGLMESPSSRRFRKIILDLIDLPESARNWASLASILHDNEVTELQVLERDGLDGRTVFSSKVEGTAGERGNRITSSFWIHREGEPSLEVLFAWKAEPGQFAPMPHEEIFLRVATDMAERFPAPQVEGANGGR